MEKMRSSCISAVILIQVLSLSAATSKDESKNIIPKEIKWYEDTAFEEEIHNADFHVFHGPHMSSAENQVNIEIEPRGSQPLNRRKIFRDENDGVNKNWPRINEIISNKAISDIYSALMSEPSDGPMAFENKDVEKDILEKFESDIKTTGEYLRNILQSTRSILQSARSILQSVSRNTEPDELDIIRMDKR